MAAAQRNYEEEGRERDRYVVLVHVLTLAQAGPSEAVATERIMRDLGFDGYELESLVQSLLHAGFLRYAPLGGVSLTKKGTEYLMRHAWRRRSVRLLG